MVVHTLPLCRVEPSEVTTHKKQFARQMTSVQSNTRDTTKNYHEDHKERKRRYKGRKLGWIFLCALPYLILSIIAAIALPILLTKQAAGTTLDVASTTSYTATTSNTSLVITTSAITTVTTVATTNVITIVTTIITTTTTTKTTTTTSSNGVYQCFNGVYWNTTSTTYAGTGTSGAALNQLNSPAGLFIDSNDTMYISDQGNCRIMAYLLNAASGTLVAGTGAGGTALNQLSAAGIRYPYVDANNEIYISDAYNNRIVQWASGGSTGVLKAGTGTGGSSLTQLNYPYGIWVDSSSNLFVAELINHRVTKWASGATVGVVVAGVSGSSGSTTSLLSSPTGLYYDEASQNLYIVNNGASATVMKWQVSASYGTVVAGVLGTTGSGASQLSAPTAITLDQGKNLYVLDRGNSRVQLFCNGSSTGITIAGNGAGGSTLAGPFDIRLDSQLNLYVAEYGGNRVTKFNKL